MIFRTANKKLNFNELRLQNKGLVKLPGKYSNKSLAQECTEYMNLGVSLAEYKDSE